MGAIADFEARPRADDGEPHHYVRVTRHDHRGYTEFQYAIGDPALYLEMILPPPAFAEFCARHAVVRLDAEVLHVD